MRASVYVKVCAANDGMVKVVNEPDFNMAGVPGELVELALAALDAPTAVSVVCTMGAAGTASAKFNGKQATCLDTCEK